MNRCGCNPISEKFEYPILDNFSDIFIAECPKKENLCKLKQKIICEFLDIINKLKCGILPDLESILEEISFVYIYEE